jgi:hypothetical protein
MVRNLSRIGCGRRNALRSGASDLAFEVAQRRCHLGVAGIGHALAVVFDDADALIARGHPD